MFWPFVFLVFQFGRANIHSAHQFLMLHFAIVNYFSPYDKSVLYRDLKFFFIDGIMSHENVLNRRALRNRDISTKPVSKKRSIPIEMKSAR